MDIKKYEEMLASLIKQEEETKATFTKIQGAKEVINALIAEAKNPTAPKKEEGMKVANIDKEAPKPKKGK